MNPFRQFIHWFSTPHSSSNIKQTNFINVQIDAIGVGLANAAAPFLPVFLTRLGATTVEVGLLSSLPAISGLLFAIPMGRFLQRQANIIPWFSGTRLMVILGYALTGIVTFIVPPDFRVISVIMLWAFQTIPQTILSISFSVVMNAVAGPTGRFELMSRRWSILGLTTTVTVFLIGQIISGGEFPLNYQLMFIALSIGGLGSFYFSSHIDIPKQPVPKAVARQRISDYWRQIISEQPFISFNVKRFVYTTGLFLATPIFPVYFVKQLQATDAWIALISTAQTGVMILGYYFWTRQSRRHGSRLVVLATTFGLSFYPLLTALTNEIAFIPLYAAFAGIFQAGLDLVFFDELLKTVPEKLSASFVSFAQSMQYIPAMIGPLLGSALADWLGLSTALIISTAIRLLGAGLFFFNIPRSSPR